MRRSPVRPWVSWSPTFAPEEGTQWETGLKFDVNKRLSGTLAFYDIQKKNVLVTDDLGNGNVCGRERPARPGRAESSWT